jgi:hypothetical protein
VCEIRALSRFDEKKTQMLWYPTRYPRLSPVCICKADSDEPEIRKITEI